MPLTPIQRAVMQLLASRRSPESHVAGGVAINRAGDSPRFSTDINFFFHDVAESVFHSAESDSVLLAQNGFDVQWLMRQPFLHRVNIGRGQDKLKLEWCFDSAFRFFPIQPDPDLGYCLHAADLATNKLLAMAGRSEIRDLIDILFLHETYLDLGAICWAACGKDPGYNPISLLETAKRHTRFHASDLAEENLAKPISLVELKDKWLQGAAKAEEMILRLPATEVGCLYLKPDFVPVTPDPASAEFPTLIRHYGSIRGAWPVVVAK
jgi:hypothetical protein